MENRPVQQSPAGASPFAIGFWHDTSRSKPIEWSSLREGERLGPCDWALEPYEAAVIAFLGDSTHDTFTPTASNPLPPVHPVAALWAAVSLRKTLYSFSGTTDFGHDVTWHRPLRCGAPARLEGSVFGVAENSGRQELTLETNCLRGTERIFRVRQTAVVGRSAKRSPTRRRSAPPVEESTPIATIRGSLAWARRPVHPPHPNFHTDHDCAVAAGFPGVVMSGMQVATQVFEALYDHLGEQSFYGTRIRYRLLRPILVDQTCHVRLGTHPRADTGGRERNLTLTDESGKPLYVGSIEEGEPEI